MQRLDDNPEELAGTQALAAQQGGGRLVRLLHGGRTVTYVARASGDFAMLYVSPNVRKVVGWSDQDFLSDPGHWLRNVHRDDLPEVERQLALVPARTDFSCEYRFRHKDGGWRWLRDEVTVWRDEAGAPFELTGSISDVTDEKLALASLRRSEKELKAARARLQDAIDSLDDAFSLFDDQDRLVTCNGRYREFYPAVADLIVPGVSFTTLTEANARCGCYDLGGLDADAWVARRLERHRACGRIDQRLVDGRELEIVERRTAEGGTVTLQRDITAQRLAERALRESAAFRQRLVDALPIPVFFRDPEGRYLFINKAMATMVGLPTHEIVGRAHDDFLPPAQADVIRESDAALLAAGGTHSYQTRMVLDGTERDLLVNKAVIQDARGTVTGWIGSLVDLTDLKRTEERLLQAAKLATLGQIASEVAHELNQPLSIIRMSLEWVMEDLHDEAFREPLRQVERQIARMGGIVGQLGVHARSDQMPDRLFSPAQAVRNAARLMAATMGSAGIDLVVETAETTACARGSRSQLEQVLLNLLANARDAVLDNPQPTERPWVRVRLVEDDLRRETRIIVSDNGGGVPEALWGKLFDPFFTTKPEGRGTGLGLSISSDIMRLFGGRLEGRNVGSGAEFEAALPAVPAAPAAPAEGVEREGAAAPVPARSVMLVDDEGEVVRCMADFLRRRGYQVVTAADGAEALRRFVVQPCDVVVTDQRMPRLAGLDLVKELRQLVPGLPVVLTTGQVDISDAEAAAERVCLLRKPVSLRTLHAAIQGLFA